MDKMRIHFIPWCLFRSPGLTWDALRWQGRAAVSKGKWYHIVHYAPPGVPNPLFLAAWQSTIYIQGHGKAGDEHLTRAPGVTEGRLLYRDVAERLVRTGLRKSFRGVIKLWICDSGLGRNKGGLETKQDDLSEDETQSFGRLFADEMRNRGYVNCRYQGYFGTVSSRYEKAFFGDDNHSMAQQYHRFTHNNPNPEYRASLPGHRGEM
jgi:hypothetical protein